MVSTIWDFQNLIAIHHHLLKYQISNWQAANFHTKPIILDWYLRGCIKVFAALDHRVLYKLYFLKNQIVASINWILICKKWNISVIFLLKVSRSSRCLSAGAVIILINHSLFSHAVLFFLRKNSLPLKEAPCA